MREELAKLKAQLAAHEGLTGQELAGEELGARGGGLFSLGAKSVDAALGGGLARGALHEVLAETVLDTASASGLASVLAHRAANGRPVVWIRDDGVCREAGMPYAPGLAEMGLDPDNMLLVFARNGLDALRAANESAACDAVGAVLIEIWGAPKALTLTATRRLALAASLSGVTLVMMRAGASPIPSAATTRWSVRAAPSSPAMANAPGLPVCALTLQRHRAGPAGHTWNVELRRENARSNAGDSDEEIIRYDACLGDAPALSGGMVPLPSGRPHDAEPETAGGAGTAARRTG